MAEDHQEAELCIRTVLYRGPLSACNYACGYCPFAKTAADDTMQAADRGALERFVDWVSRRQEQEFRIFFTPRGEALTCAWYPAALATLSHLPQVSRVAIQTNLSCDLQWLEACDVRKLGLWCSYHPDQVGRAPFLGQCACLRAAGVRHSVGMVGLKRLIPELEAMRHALPASTYLWVNTCREETLIEKDRERILAVDPLFRFSGTHASAGHLCDCGHTVIAVDGEGTVRRCHFVSEPLGNLYRDDLASLLQLRPCPNATCWCHIGYVHLHTLPLRARFGSGILERVLC